MYATENVFMNRGLLKAVRSISYNYLLFGGWGKSTYNLFPICSIVFKWGTMGQSGLAF